MFDVGDPVVHPVRGAGIVTDIEELQRHDGSKRYYKIKLLSQIQTTLMIPIKVAKARGLRHAIQRSNLKQIWRVLRAAPEKLPANYKKRYAALEAKLQTGDPLQIAEVVRDMAWRQEQEGSLNTIGKRKYNKGISLLGGEIAATQGTNLEDGEEQVRHELWESIP